MFLSTKIIAKTFNSNCSNCLELRPTNNYFKKYFPPTFFRIVAIGDHKKQRAFQVVVVMALKFSAGNASSYWIPIIGASTHHPASRFISITVADPANHFARLCYQSPSRKVGTWNIGALTKKALGAVLGCYTVHTGQSVCPSTPQLISPGEKYFETSLVLINQLFLEPNVAKKTLT